MPCFLQGLVEQLAFNRVQHGRPFPRCQRAEVGLDRFREFDLVGHPPPNDAVVNALSPGPRRAAMLSVRRTYASAAGVAGRLEAEVSHEPSLLAASGTRFQFTRMEGEVLSHLQLHPIDLGEKPGCRQVVVRGIRLRLAEMRHLSLEMADPL